jgi:hypothetical protein
MDWKHTATAVALVAVGIILGFAAYSMLVPYLPGAMTTAPTA